MTFDTEQRAPRVPRPEASFPFESPLDPLDYVAKQLGELADFLERLTEGQRDAALEMALGVFAAQEGINPAPDLAPES